MAGMTHRGRERDRLRTSGDEAEMEGREVQKASGREERKEKTHGRQLERPSYVLRTTDRWRNRQTLKKSEGKRQRRETDRQAKKPRAGPERDKGGKAKERNARVGMIKPPGGGGDSQQQLWADSSGTGRPTGQGLSVAGRGTGLTQGRGA